jgi:sterol desaturase/sphingolipid hydroxylase (fatty acid hydroxylase superfamily)
VNVHPFEFLAGEYCHWWALFLLNCAGVRVHILSVATFMFLGGVLATLNHTRWNAKVSLFGVTLFEAASHDVHHRLPLTNYGQYIMFWDYVLGTYRPYDEADRVNASWQKPEIRGIVGKVAA